MAMAAISIAVAYLVFFHLDRFPRLFYDKGSYLEVSRNLAEHGLYAESSSDGPVYYGATLAVGPTVHGSIAAVFLLFGPGVLQARLLITVFLLAATVLFYALARRLGGTRLAWAATILLVVVPSVSFVPLGRQVMGEVPGFAFLLAGLVLWFRDWGRQSTAVLVGVGLLLGLAAITKNQFALVLDAALVGGALLNALHYRLVRPRVFLVPLAVTVACHVAATAALLAIVPAEGRAEIIANGSYVGSYSTLMLPPLRRLPEAMRELLRPGAYFLLLTPAIAYGVYRARKRRPREQMWAAVLLIVLANFGWFALFTIAWRRYAFLGLALSSLFVARLLARLSGDFRLRFTGTGLASALRAAVLAWAALGVCVSAARLARDIAVAPPDDASLMAAYLDANLPPDAVIEAWEPEVAFLSQHRFHRPPSNLMGEAIAHTFFHGPPVYMVYKALDASPRWLLVGEFAVYGQVYPFEEVDRRYRLVQRYGAYQLFERKEP